MRFAEYNMIITLYYDVYFSFKTSINFSFSSVSVLKIISVSVSVSVNENITDSMSDEVLITK